jgi:hypothetical protein
MPFPFSVGDFTMQSVLDWAAEPPPARARDTHAVRFRLQKRTGTHLNPQYSGLMFFRPEGVSASFVGRRPGLDGFGGLLVTDHACQALLDPTTAVQPAELVKVFLAFRQQQTGPAQIIATLTFMDGDLLQLPIQTTGEVVEFSHVEMSGSSIFMDPPQGWDMILERTTALLGRI